MRRSARRRRRGAAADAGEPQGRVRRHGNECRTTSGAQQPQCPMRGTPHPTTNSHPPPGSHEPQSAPRRAPSAESPVTARAFGSPGLEARRQGSSHLDQRDAPVRTRGCRATRHGGGGATGGVRHVDGGVAPQRTWGTAGQRPATRQRVPNGVRRAAAAVPRPRAAPRTPPPTVTRHPDHTSRSQHPAEPRPRSHPLQGGRSAHRVSRLRPSGLRTSTTARRRAAPPARRRRSGGRRSARRRRRGATANLGNGRAASGDTATSAERRPARSSRSAPPPRGTPHPTTNSHPPPGSHEPQSAPRRAPSPESPATGGRSAHRVSTTLAGARCSTTTRTATIPTGGLSAHWVSRLRPSGLRTSTSARQRVRQPSRCSSTSSRDGPYQVIRRPLTRRVGVRAKDSGPSVGEKT